MRKRMRVCVRAHARVCEMKSNAVLFICSHARETHTHTYRARVPETYTWTRSSLHAQCREDHYGQSCQNAGKEQIRALLAGLRSLLFLSLARGRGNLTVYYPTRQPGVLEGALADEASSQGGVRLQDAHRDGAERWLGMKTRHTCSANVCMMLSLAL